MKGNFLFLILLGLTHAATGQKLVGKVLDRDTNKPIPYASISVLNSSLGTTSNVDGEFELSTSWLPGKIIVSDLSHLRDTLNVTTGQPLQVRLQPISITLPDVIVGDFTSDLIKKAYRQLKATNSAKWYSNAFYRQTTKLNGEVTEMQEMVWDAKTSNAGIEGVALLQARYAEKKKSLINFKDFPHFTRALKIYSSSQDSSTVSNVLSPNVNQYYNLRLLGVAQRNQHDVVEIGFTAKPGANVRNVTGSVFIDESTYQVLKFHVTTPDIHYKSNNPTFSFKESSTSFELVFKYSTTGASILDYITITHQSTINRPFKDDVKIQVSSITSFYNEQPTPANVTYALASETQLDLTTIKRTAYDANFWKNNSAIKRTPSEEEAISSFEQSGAFGTMTAR
jgi:hypothetical protein